jgi:UDP-sulfoquinovose synthase
VQRVAGRRGLTAPIEHRDNPRVEREAHYYHAKNTSLLMLGLQPHLLDDSTIDAMLDLTIQHRDRVSLDLIAPHVRWAPGAARERLASSTHAPAPIVPPDPASVTTLNA